jgi:3-methyladenine DNA glycosylase AlkD
MQAYMKSAMPYYGVGMPGQQVIWKKLFRQRVICDARSWRETTLAIWRGAKFREERYGAIALTGEKAYLPWQTLDALPMYEEMIVTGAWWDYVDHIAGRRIGLLLRNHPAPMSRLMRRWSRSDDMWKRRTSIICQLGFKERTDLALLYDCIEPNLDDGEFFIRKAIGWALRQHAWTDPEEVQRYVRAHEDQLSGLSRREALKNVGR